MQLRELKKNVVIPTPDGWNLAATLFLPEEEIPRRVLIIGAAIGAKRERYFAFAEHMARLGWVVVTFTYRGLGDSIGNANAPTPSLADWGRVDLTTVIDWAAKQFPELPLVGVFHSISGQLIGLAENHEKIVAAAAISTPRHVWSLWKGPYRYVVYLFFKWLVPLAVKIRGRLRLSKVSPLYDLPKEVALQWARTGLYETLDTQNFKDAVQGFERYKTPTLFVSFDDDTGIAPHATVDYLRSQIYKNAYTEHHHIRHTVIGVDAIGHSGFFDGQVEAKWWDELNRRLETLMQRSVS